MMVTHQISPISRLPSAIGMPKKITQMMFAIREIAPPPYLTSFPNGRKDSLANLKHCSPYGMPMMLMHQIAPENSQASPLRQPPNMNHMMLPNVPVVVPSCVRKILSSGLRYDIICISL